MFTVKQTKRCLAHVAAAVVVAPTGAADTERSCTFGMHRLLGFFTKDSAVR